MLPKYNFPKASDETKKGLLVMLIIASFISNVVIFREQLLDNQMLEVELSKQIESGSVLLAQLKHERSKSNGLQNNLNAVKESNDQIKMQVETLTSSVGVLQKLTSTDPELLKKYSKIYFLNENYKPEGLANIDPSFLIQKERVTQINSKVLPYLQKMLADATEQGVDLKILSAYRSFAEQGSLKSAYTVTYGSGANKFSADQGYSEHQLGTTADFTNTKNGAVLTGFDKTSEYEWLMNNAYKYGFVISYPKENTYYIFEPWHWRYVGINLATQIHNDNTYFYALDQRYIDGYLVDLFN